MTAADVGFLIPVRLILGANSGAIEPKVDPIAVIGVVGRCRFSPGR
jgi:hypothetical protein